MTYWMVTTSSVNLLCMGRLVVFGGADQCRDTQNCPNSGEASSKYTNTQQGLFFLRLGANSLNSLWFIQWLKLVNLTAWPNSIIQGDFFFRFNTLRPSVELFVYQYLQFKYKILFLAIVWAVGFTSCNGNLENGAFLRTDNIINT